MPLSFSDTNSNPNCHTDEHAYGHADQHANSHADEHVDANGHAHCDSNQHADCHTYDYLPGLSSTAVEEPLVIVDIMLVVAHWGETCE
ncbi:MAG: hypothetical protein H8E35_01910 [Ardenticatenia bacterium]|nr:hypothetical protein [Ardenticatenia bacterium]